MKETITTTLTCVDANVTTNKEVIQQGKLYKGSFEYQDDDHVRFIEESKSSHAHHPELEWHPVAGSLHGKLSVNANGSMLIMYLRHGEYNSDGHQLADALASEVEQIGEVLVENNLSEEIARCS